MYTKIRVSSQFHVLNQMPSGHLQIMNTEGKFCAHISRAIFSCKCSLFPALKFEY